MRRRNESAAFPQDGRGRRARRPRSASRLPCRRAPGREVDRPDGDPGQDRPEGDHPGHGHELGPVAELRPGRPLRGRPLHRHLRDLREHPSPRRSSARSSNAPRCARMSTSSPRTPRYRKSMGTGAARMFEQQLNASLERLRTDYVDCYYLHGLAGNQIELLHDPDVKAAFEALKKPGKIRFCGLSCHDARLPEIVEAAAECGWIDQIMIKYNFRDVGGRDRHDDLQRAIDKAVQGQPRPRRHEDAGRRDQLPGQDGASSRPRASRRKSRRSRPSGWTAGCTSSSAR